LGGSGRWPDESAPVRDVTGNRPDAFGVEQAAGRRGDSVGSRGSVRAECGEDFSHRRFAGGHRRSPAVDVGEMKNEPA
jgi:hypothetical protein